MDRWGELLDHLTTAPRENGTAALGQTASWLARFLGQQGIDVQMVAWDAHPWRLRLVGIGCFLAALAYVWLLRSRQGWAALAVALLVPAWLLVELDLGIPVTGWIHPVAESHLVARIPPAEGTADQRLIFSSHYDTKTDLFDHLERAPFVLASVPLALLLVLGAIAAGFHGWPKLVRGAQIAALFNGVLFLLIQTGGALVGAKSPGAVDSGAGCAVLLDLAKQLHARPLAHTEVELVFFSGEELGIEGSRVWAKQRFGAGLDKPTYDLNLDGVGESPRLAVMKSETALVRGFRPDEQLFALVDQIHRERIGAPLHRTFYSGVTDARAFLEVGVPALSMTSDLPGHAIQRKLHSRKDSPDRVHPAALTSTSEVLLETARRLDATSR
jgi:hypothetical protein